MSSNQNFPEVANAPFSFDSHSKMLVPSSNTLPLKGKHIWPRQNETGRDSTRAKIHIYIYCRVKCQVLPGVLWVWDKQHGTLGEDSIALKSNSLLQKGRGREKPSLTCSGGLLSFPVRGQLRFYSVHLFSYTTVK